MTTYYGVNATKAVSPAPASYMGTENKGRVISRCDKYEAASLAAGSVVIIGDLIPAGATFLNGYVRADDLSSAGTLALGDYASDKSTVGDADRYLAATVFTTAGQCTQCTAEAGWQYTLTQDSYLALTTATEEMTGTIWVTTFWAMP